MRLPAIGELSSRALRAPIDESFLYRHLDNLDDPQQQDTPLPLEPSRPPIPTETSVPSHQPEHTPPSPTPSPATALTTSSTPAPIQAKPITDDGHLGGNTPNGRNDDADVAA